MTTPRIPARPTIYRGVQMRSRLEAAWAEQFDAMEWPWQYEPICLATTDGQYLPDFHVSIPGFAEHVYVEVKPSTWISPEENGYTGDWRDVDSWNAAASAIGAKLQRLERIIAANARIDLLIVCTSSSEGRVTILASSPGIEPRTNTYEVVPGWCRFGSHWALVSDPVHSGCIKHACDWRVPTPVASLYAPDGFSDTSFAQPLEDHFVRWMRERGDRAVLPS